MYKMIRKFKFHTYITYKEHRVFNKLKYLVLQAHDAGTNSDHEIAIASVDAIVYERVKKHYNWFYFMKYLNCLF